MNRPRPLDNDEHALLTINGSKYPLLATASSDSCSIVDAKMFGPSASPSIGANQPPSRPTASRQKPSRQLSARALFLSLLSATTPTAMAQCISLKGSTQCPAFSAASISTDTTLVGYYPFLHFVSDVSSFDAQLAAYVKTSYVQEKYQTLLGCGNVVLTNTSELYARFTTTVICNGIVQNSISNCSLSGEQSRPVCADTCAQFAESEAYITADNGVCSNPSAGASTQIRADFTNCALPADSLSSSNCIEGITNEPDNCGYGNSTIGLCSYCASGGINSTDTCCYNSNAEKRCVGVVLPSITATMTFGTAEPTASGNGTAAAAEGGSHLSGGAIAGIVVGAFVLCALIAFALFFFCWRRKRTSGSQNGSLFNQPSPARKGPPSMVQKAVGSSPTATGYEVLPGGRIARMSALEGHSGDSPSRHSQSAAGPAAAAGAAAGYAAGRRRVDDHSSSDGYGESPGSSRAGVLRPPPTNIRRNGSLSSGSMLAGDDPQSPGSAGDMSSPQGVASQQSEQLPFFKDYYSADDIHPGDRVSVLWAYQPRAADEFALERGDMLKVVGIWDDGWATGVMVDERAEDWDLRRQAQRDSGVSNTSGRREESPPVSGEIKAFPLVCVCLPEHWRKTIEDGTTESSGQSARPTS